MTDLLARPLTLPCGATLRRRLAKAASDGAGPGPQLLVFARRAGQALDDALRATARVAGT